MGIDASIWIILIGDAASIGMSNSSQIKAYASIKCRWSQSQPVYHLSFVVLYNVYTTFNVKRILFFHVFDLDLKTTLLLFVANYPKQLMRSLKTIIKNGR